MDQRPLITTTTHTNPNPNPCIITTITNSRRTLVDPRSTPSVYFNKYSLLSLIATATNEIPGRHPYNSFYQRLCTRTRTRSTRPSHRRNAIDDYYRFAQSSSTARIKSFRSIGIERIPATTQPGPSSTRRFDTDSDIHHGRRARRTRESGTC